MNVRIRQQQNKVVKFLIGLAGVYLFMAVVPIILYLVFVVSAMISPPQMCQQSLASPEEQYEFQGICKNRLSRPLMYIYPILFVNDADI